MKDIKKTDNYFERNRITRQARNYRYNFIDYLYYQGKRYEKRWPTSCSGSIMVSWYWLGVICIPGFFLFLPEIVDIFSPYRIHPLGVLALTIIILELPPTLWCIFRYRKERVAAIKHHFRRSTWHNAISIWWILFAPFLITIATIIYVVMNRYNQ